MLQGKVAIVSGGASGIGRAVSLAFASAGAKVIVNDLGVNLDGSGSSSGPADAVVNEIKAAGGEAITCFEDISTMAGGRRTIESAVDTFGRVDVLGCLAGISRPAPFTELTEQDWDSVIATHLKGHFALMQPAVIQMTKQKSGSIIAFTSTAGLDGSPPQANYSAAKAGIVGLMRTVALSAYPHVRCNAVAPSARTRLTNRIRPEHQTGTPEQITGLLTFLGSDRSKHITGQLLYVTGRGNRVELFPQPRAVRTVSSETDWSADRLADVWDSALGSDQLVRAERYWGNKADTEKAS